MRIPVIVRSDFGRNVSLTRFIDALERLAHATTNKGTVTASPLQALVRRGVESITPAANKKPYP
jgi:hypothetical protein